MRPDTHCRKRRAMQHIFEGTTRFGGFRFGYRLHTRSSARFSNSASMGRTPILFLSGAFQSMDSWKRFVRAFESTGDVLLVDLPGSGCADALPSEYGLDYLTDALRHLLDELRIDRVYLIAASYGSPVAYRFAQREPERVAKLVLAGIMKEIPERRIETVQESVELAISGDTRRLAALACEGLLCQNPDKPIVRRRLARRVLAGGLTAMNREDRHRYILNTRRLLLHDPLDLDRPPEVPTLVFTGEHDVFTTPDACYEVAMRIPDAYFTTILEADHLFHVERFDVTAELLLRFQQGDLERPHGGWSPPKRAAGARPLALCAPGV